MPDIAPAPQIKSIINGKTVSFIWLHLLALASAILLIGPTNIQALFSHDPVKVTIAVAGAILALGTTLGAAVAPQLVQFYHTNNVETIVKEEEVQA